jgi:hypothetical protein
MVFVQVALFPHVELRHSSMSETKTSIVVLIREQ